MTGFSIFKDCFILLLHMTLSVEKQVLPGKIPETTSIFFTERVLYSRFLKSGVLVTYDRHERGEERGK